MSAIGPIYQELAVKIGKPNLKNLPLLLAKLANPEEARILNALSASSEALAKQLNLNQEVVEKHLKALFEKGLVFQGKTGWHLTRTWGGLHDSAGSADVVKHKDVFDKAFFKLLQATSEEDREQRIDDVLNNKAPLRRSMRVIPRWKSIKNIPGLLPYEDIRQIFKASDPIALVPCACKRAEPERKCKETVPEVTCVTTNRSAQYNLRRGAGKKLTYDEVMALFDQFDQLQFVHLSGNSNRMPLLICNCHYDCCGQFQVNKYARERLNQDVIVKSRFIATIDPKKCKGCRLCMEKGCPVGADQIKYYAELGEERAAIDAELCIGCGLCVINCPSEARMMKMVRPPDHIPAPDAMTGEAD
ncbi:MAG: 4Fe-4S dicluster domain-containing protein [Thermodesulfobacteriota bacterium]|jgi:ferredoxin